MNFFQNIGPLIGTCNILSLPPPICYLAHTLFLCPLSCVRQRAVGQSSIRFRAAELQDNYRPPQGSSFFSSPARQCCATLIYLNILVLRPSFFLPLLCCSVSFSAFIIFSGKHGAAARAGPLSSARLFVLVLLCSRVQAYISRQHMSSFFHIQAHANTHMCWHAITALTKRPYGEWVKKRGLLFRYFCPLLRV